MRTASEGKRTLSDYTDLCYSIQLVPEPEGGFTVLIPDLPGCISQGETEQEALANIKDAKDAWLKVAFDYGDEIPLPSEKSDYNGKVLVRMSSALHRRLIEGARQEGVSLNQHLVSLLSERDAYCRIRQDLERISMESNQAHASFNRLLAKTIAPSMITRTSWAQAGKGKSGEYAGKGELLPFRRGEEAVG